MPTTTTSISSCAKAARPRLMLGKGSGAVLRVSHSDHRGRRARHRRISSPLRPFGTGCPRSQLGRHPTGHVHTPRPGHDRILFLGNLRYAPNIEAAQWLVRNVLPRLDERWTIDLAGAAAPEVEALAGRRVVVHGHIQDVAAAVRG